MGRKQLHPDGQVTTTVRLPIDLATKLAKLADKEQRSIAFTVREAIAEYLKGHK